MLISQWDNLPAGRLVCYWNVQICKCANVQKGIADFTHLAQDSVLLLGVTIRPRLPLCGQYVPPMASHQTDAAFS